MRWLDALTRRLSPGAEATVTECMAETYDASIAASMTRLGMIFHNALGVDRDPAQTVSWWLRGAERVDADGHAMLGAAYHLGAGVKRDPIEAFTWLTRARAGGSTLAAGFLDAVRAGLSAQEIAAGERRAGAPLPEPSS